MQELARALAELHEVHMAPVLTSVRVPPDKIPSQHRYQVHHLPSCHQNSDTHKHYGRSDSLRHYFSRQGASGLGF